VWIQIINLAYQRKKGSDVGTDLSQYHYHTSGQINTVQYNTIEHFRKRNTNVQYQPRFIKSHLYVELVTLIFFAQLAIGGARRFFP
jgi:hypothetical protein